MISRGKCLELNFTTSQFLNKLSEHLFGIVIIWKSQFKTNVSVSKRGFSLSGLCQVPGANSETITAMATDLSVHFVCKLLHYLESFILSKSILSRGCLSVSWFALWKIYDQNVTLENSTFLVVFYSFGEKSLSFLSDFGLAKGLGTNKESAPYKMIEIKLHKTLHLFVAQWSISKFAVGNWNSLPLSSQRSF